MKRILIAATLLLLSAAPFQRAFAQDFVVVVNAANPIKSISKEDLSDLFLKKVTRWETKKPVVPVDQERNAKVRTVFSKTVHDRSVSSVVTYWQTQIFSGNNVPPATKPNDADVLTFIRGNENAIGYVSAGTTLGDKVKALSVTGLKQDK